MNYRKAILGVVAASALALAAAPAASADTIRLLPTPGTAAPSVSFWPPAAQPRPSSIVKPSLRMRIARLRSIYNKYAATTAASNWDISHSFCQASLHGYTGADWAPDNDVRGFWDYIVAVVGSSTFKPYQTRWVSTRRYSDGAPEEKLALDMVYWSNGAWRYWGAYYAWGRCYYSSGYHDAGWTSP